MRRKLSFVTALILALILCLSGCTLAQKGPAPTQAPIPTAAPTEVPAPTAEPAPQRTPEPTAGPEPADWSPDIRFTTRDSEGREWTDACFRDAKLTMVNYWAYWCGPCVGELPDLQKLSEDYADKGLQLLGIADVEEEAENVAIMEHLGVTYPCLRYTSEFDPYLDTGYIPDTVFIDSSGRVVSEVYVGSQSYEAWADIIDSLLP